MQGADLVFLLPHILLAGGAVVLMLGIAFYRSYVPAFSLTLLALAAALAAFPSPSLLPVRITPLFVVDTYSVFFSRLLILATAAVALISYRHLKGRPGIREEYYILLLLSCFGALVLAGSVHMASFFLGLELMGVSLYTLISYQRETAGGMEAGIKYLVLAGVSSAFLLFGAALLYFDTGSLDFAGIAASLGRHDGVTAPTLAGIVLVLAGIAFKLGLVPFHMWTPDVYQGAPAPVTALITTVSKGSVFALLVRFYASGSIPPDLMILLTAIAAASMLGGNLLALFQDNVKRLLAYSSIAHMGYALVAFLPGGDASVTAVTFYLVCYFLSILGAFSVMAALSGPQREAEALEDYRGLFARSPWLALLFSLFLLSLAGLPLTAGFMGKFAVMRAGLGSGLWFAVAALIAGSAIGLYYYLRVLTAMFVGKEGETPTAIPSPGPMQTVALAILGLGLLWIGIYPGGLLRLIGTLAAGMG